MWAILEKWHFLLLLRPPLFSSWILIMTWKVELMTAFGQFKGNGWFLDMMKVSIFEEWLLDGGVQALKVMKVSLKMMKVCLFEDDESVSPWRWWKFNSVKMMKVQLFEDDESLSPWRWWKFLWRWWKFVSLKETSRNPSCDRIVNPRFRSRCKS